MNPRRIMYLRLSNAALSPEFLSREDERSARATAEQSTSDYYYYDAPFSYLPPDQPASKTRVPTPYAVQWVQHWSESSSKRARYKTYCQACRQSIRIGDPIVYHFGLRRFVHEPCRSMRTPTHEEFIPPPPSHERVPRDILGPDSPLDQLSKVYRDEAVRWV